MNLEKDLIDSLLDYAVAFEELLLMVKYADLIMVQYCEHKQKNVVEKTIFQGYHVEIFPKVFQAFYFVLKNVLLSKEHVKFFANDNNRVQQFPISELRYSVLL